MVEILAGIILAIIALVVAYWALVFALIGLMHVVAGVWLVITAPWTIYRRRRAAREELIAQRTAAVERAFIREQYLQNGVDEKWLEFACPKLSDYDDESPQAR